MSQIEYFYAAHSGFAYLGSARFMEIASAAKRRITHKPIDLSRVIVAAGAGTFRERTQNHRAYFFGREIERWSEHRSAPVVDHRPIFHDNDVTLANCMLIAAIEQSHIIDRLAHALLQAHWRDDADLADRPTLAELAGSVGLDPDPLLEAAHSAQIQAIYEANTAEAIERSVFGSPTYFVDGDMFYGQDRLELVERALSRPYAGAWPKH
jgi:2-hydroxychromene-2-carboxylate isomerase